MKLDVQQEDNRKYMFTNIFVMILPNCLDKERYDWILRGNPFYFANCPLSAWLRLNIHHPKSCINEINTKIKIEYVQ